MSSLGTIVEMALLSLDLIGHYEKVDGRVSSVSEYSKEFFSVGSSKVPVFQRFLTA